MQYPRHSPRSAWELQKKSVPQRIPVKLQRKNYKKITGGELICKNFGVNGIIFGAKTSTKDSRGSPDCGKETMRLRPISRDSTDFRSLLKKWTSVKLLVGNIEGITVRFLGDYS